MIRAALVLALGVIASPSLAQEITLETLPALDDSMPAEEETLEENIPLSLQDLPDSETSTTEALRAAIAPAGILRVLDRVTGELVDMELASGQSTGYGRIEIALTECRFPEDDPSSDAFAYVTVRNAGVAAPVFDGWMVASSPALNALDHPRYDVWVLRCKSE